MPSRSPATLPSSSLSAVHPSVQSPSTASSPPPSAALSPCSSTPSMSGKSCAASRAPSYPAPPRDLSTDHCVIYLLCLSELAGVIALFFAVARGGFLAFGPVQQ